MGLPIEQLHIVTNSNDILNRTMTSGIMKIDKVTVWDGGNNPDGSSATSNFVSSLVQSLPPIHDVAKMSGVELPDYLGTMSDEKSSKE